MSNDENSKYDLEERTYKFAVACRDFIKNTSRSITSTEYCIQLSRSSGSVAAIYIEANEALSKKDFLIRIKICRKEAKESVLWLKLLDSLDSLKQEATELMKIFGAILEKSK